MVQCKIDIYTLNFIVISNKVKFKFGTICDEILQRRNQFLHVNIAVMFLYQYHAFYAKINLPFRGLPKNESQSNNTNAGASENNSSSSTHTVQNTLCNPKDQG